MATKLICVVLLALFAVQASGSIAQDLENIIKNNIALLIQGGEGVETLGGQELEEIKNTSEAIINNATKDINSKLQDTISIIKNLAANGPFGDAIKVGQCVQTAIAAATKDAATGIKNVTACVTDEVNAIVGPVKDLIANGNKVITSAVDIYNNFSSCFPNGVSSPDLLCLVQKVASLGTGITSTLTGLATDIQQIKTAVDNFRNAVVRCPRERIGDLTTAFGYDVTNFGNCVNAVNSA